MEQTTQMERILAELKTSLRELAGDRLIKTVLYGSRARGDYDEDSDTDVAVIIRGLSRDLKNRILDRVAGIEIDHLRSLSVLIFSEEEFEFLRKRERRIAIDIEQEGIPL